MSAWSFRRRHGVCATCEREFSHREAHYSALYVDGEELARDDFCRACWRVREKARTSSEEGAAAAPGALFWWRTQHEVGKKKGLALNFEAIEALFLGLEGREQRHLREMRYVLCLLLMRKRRLKIERILRDAEGEAMIVRRPRRKESLRVFVFDFDAERMEALRGELVKLFDSEDADLASAVAGQGAGEPDADREEAPEGAADAS